MDRQCLLMIVYFFSFYWLEFDLVLVCVSALQLAMRGPPGPMGLTGRSGPVVSVCFLCLVFLVVSGSLDLFYFSNRASLTLVYYLICFMDSKMSCICLYFLVFSEQIYWKRHSRNPITCCCCISDWWLSGHTACLLGATSCQENFILLLSPLLPLSLGPVDTGSTIYLQEKALQKTLRITAC